MFEKLDKYSKIGLDFDGTLIGNKLSNLLIEYILKNPHKEYHIITFRVKEWVDEIPYSLSTIYDINFFDTSIIKTIQSIPETLHLQYKLAKNLGYDYNHIYYKSYYGWKADICKEMGVEVLVDDNPKVKENLEKNCIFFINI